MLRERLSAIGISISFSESFDRCREPWRKARWCLAPTLVALMAMCACGSGSTQQQPQLPGPATHFSVTGGANATAGLPVTLTVTALDASNNVATSYAGEVQYTSSDPQAVLVAGQTLSAGTGTTQVTFYTAGNQTVSAKDSGNGSITGTSTAINVKVLTTTHFSVTLPGTAITGSAFNFTVTALDASNNQVGTYSGIVHFTSSDAQAVVPGDQTLQNGTATLSATFKTAGSQTIMGTDTAMSAITGNSLAITVKGASHFSITTPASVTADSAFPITVNALTDTNDPVPAYTGTVSFASSDSHADLPPTQAITSGTQTFNAAFKTAGSQTIAATDTVTSITGTSSAITVKAAVAANPVPLVHLPLSPGAALPGDSGFMLTVNGSGFVAGSTVQWNGSSRTTTFVSKSILKATILATDIATPNTASVTVVSPGPGGGTSNVAFFETTVPTLGVDFGSSAVNNLQSPIAVATGDFNRDGKLDAAVVNGNNVTILLGSGDGTFQAPVNYATTAPPNALAVADLNGDGKLDLIVGINGAGINILLGNGDGTFQTAVNDATPCCGSSMAVGDFNEDGKLDVVMPGEGANVLLGNGDGTFQPALNYPAGLNTIAIAVGDFNGDGHLDLAVTDAASNNVYVLLGNGDGTFQVPLANPVGTNPVSLVVGDSNGDGILDMAATNNGSNSVSVLIGNGNGTFKPAVNNGTSAGTAALTAADLNGDGKLDLAVDGSEMQVLLGNGDGTFQPAASFAALSQTSNTVATGDFNGQGRLDVLLPLDGSDVAEMLQATLAPSTISVTFPLQLVQINSTAQEIALTNVTDQAISISSIVVAGTNAAEFLETDTCGATVAAESTCTISVNFTPVQVGPRTATITVTNTGLGSPLSIALNGTGVVSGPNATLSATSVSVNCRRYFGRCFCLSSPPLTLTDYGTANLSITGISATSPFTDFSSCGTGLTPANSCAINFRMSTGGSSNGTVTITDNDPSSPQTVTLTGNSSCQ